jgi:hypothetical protein
MPVRWGRAGGCAAFGDHARAQIPDRAGFRNGLMKVKERGSCFLRSAAGDGSIRACSFRSPISPSRLCCGYWSACGVPKLASSAKRALHPNGRAAAARLHEPLVESEARHAPSIAFCRRTNGRPVSVPKTRFRLQTTVVREESIGVRSASAYRRGLSDRRLDSLTGGVRRGDIGFFGKRLRLWRRDAGFFLWHGLWLLRLRLALFAFTLGIQDITGQRNLLRCPYETTSTHRSLPRTAGGLHSRGFAYKIARARAASALHHKLGRIPNPIDLQEDRISAPPHGAAPSRSGCKNSVFPANRVNRGLRTEFSRPMRIPPGLHRRPCSMASARCELRSIARDVFVDSA